MYSSEPWCDMIHTWGSAFPPLWVPVERDRSPDTMVKHLTLGWVWWSQRLSPVTSQWITGICDLLADAYKSVTQPRWWLVTDMRASAVSYAFGVLAAFQTFTWKVTQLWPIFVTKDYLTEVHYHFSTTALCVEANLILFAPGAAFVWPFITYPTGGILLNNAAAYKVRASGWNGDNIKIPLYTVSCRWEFYFTVAMGAVLLPLFHNARWLWAPDLVLQFLKQRQKTGGSLLDWPSIWLLRTWPILGHCKGRLRLTLIWSIIDWSLRKWQICDQCKRSSSLALGALCCFGKDIPSLIFDLQQLAANPYCNGESLNPDGWTKKI